MSMLNKHAMSILKSVKPVKEENIIEEILWRGIADINIDVVVKFTTSLHRRYSVGTKEKQEVRP